jgi:hypothetical protein
MGDLRCLHAFLPLTNCFSQLLRAGTPVGATMREAWLSPVLATIRLKISDSSCFAGVGCSVPVIFLRRDFVPPLFSNDLPSVVFSRFSR